jgi:hypothetical protein
VPAAQAAQVWSLVRPPWVEMCSPAAQMVHALQVWLLVSVE